MADDRPSDNPRRAAAGEEPAPGQPPSPGPAAAESPAAAGHSGSDATGSTGDTGLSGRFTEDEARPIFREAAADADAATVRTAGGHAEAPRPSGDTDAGTATVTGTPSSAPADAAPADGDTADGGTSETEDAGPAGTAPVPSRRLNFTPRPRPADDDEATTLLPRTTGAAGEERALTADDDLDDLEDRPRRLGGRARLALLISAVAAVVVIGLAIGYAVVGVRDQPATTGDPSQGPSSSGAGTPSAAALLDDASMLTAEGARPTDPKRTWTVGSTVRGPIPAGSGPGCLGSDPLEGAPTAQQTITRTLTASGTKPPSTLHVAEAYGSVADATQAFAVTSRALGTCAVTGDWLFTGRGVQGVGDESTAAAVRSSAGGRTTQHWVVVSRTGRVIDIVDAGTPGKTPLNVNNVTASLATVVGAQCATAGGACPTTPTTTDGPPPPGGDEPGFLATGDLPPVGSTPAPWVGTPVEPPTEDFTGSQCESVNWSTTAATRKSSRVYLLQDVPGIFGLNDIVLTVKDESAATKLVDKIKSDWASCKERKLTASVASATKVTGIAAGGAKITGWTTEVEQKAGSTTTRFRVGIASSGNKVAFVFLNPQKGLDVDDEAWNTVTIRAVQRLTQQS